MKHKFKIGDVVVVISKIYNGRKFTIRGLKGKFSDYVPIGLILEKGFKDCPCYDIGEGFEYGEEIALELYYDGDIKSSWTECAWKPKQLEKAK